MKERGKTTKENPGPIFAETVSLPNDVIQQLPIQDTCKRTIRNQRKNPNLHKALGFLCSIPAEYSKMQTGENLLMYDNGSYNPKRILVFATDKIITLFQKQKMYTWMVYIITLLHRTFLLQVNIEFRMRLMTPL